ncbi:beta-1,3-galactosyltransferase 4 [Alligator sinensis]|uniref:Hexosyltransferase n=1 Tax=Alligator sinensis TaxID=38654 RepID=A0A1U7SAU7_ALLSI|nr:beta-1,3-galactosyltransferase 4 [Alligator sinensis]
MLPSPEACQPRAPFLLVLVASAPAHAGHREAIRRSWGGARRASGYPVRTLFVLGLPDSRAEQAALEREAQQHGDLMQGRFHDTYANLTIKTCMLLRWAAALCPGAAFVAKVDDDVFLNLPALAHHLGSLANPHGLYLGRVHWWVHPNRDPHSRHHVPVAVFAGAAFPPYCSGTAYVLSGDAVRRVLVAAPHLVAVGPEDVFVGRCAHRTGLAPTHTARMGGATRLSLDACCYGQVLFSIHGVQPAQMGHAWGLLGGRGWGEGPEEPTGLCSPLQWGLGLLRCKVLALFEKL